MSATYQTYLEQISPETNFTFPPEKEFPKEEKKETIIQIDRTCSTNSDCSWQITNCCPETAGGKWECINAAKSIIKCEELVLCPQVISPKPTTACECVVAKCEAR